MALSRNCLLADIDIKIEEKSFIKKKKKYERSRINKSNIIVHSYGLPNSFKLLMISLQDKHIQSIPFDRIPVNFAT